jgi:hypothetical protein
MYFDQRTVIMFYHVLYCLVLSKVNTCKSKSKGLHPLGDLHRVYRRNSLFAGNAAKNNKGVCDKRTLKAPFPPKTWADRQKSLFFLKNLIFMAGTLTGFQALELDITMITKKLSVG